MNEKRAKGFTLAEFIAFLAIILLLFLVLFPTLKKVREVSLKVKSNITAESKAIEESKMNAYLIEYLPSEERPQIARIVGLMPEGRELFSGSNYGYGSCFSEAFKELGKKYEIGEITSILYQYNQASVAKELYVHIKPL